MSERTVITRPPVSAEQAVARRIRDLRRAPEWSQADLAARMTSRGWPWYPQTVARIEGGHRHLRIGELADLADIFAVTPSALLGDLDVPAAATARAALERDLREQMATEILAGATPALRLAESREGAA